MQKVFSLLYTAFFVFSLAACNSSSVEGVIDVIDGVPRKDIDTSRLGVNAFASDSRFGTPRSQFLEVRDTLRLRFIRVLLEWSDGVQPSPSAEPSFSFYDKIISAIPSGVDALVVLTGIPSWMQNSNNWINGNPRTTFDELWVRKVVARYGGNARVVGFQIWNEPNMDANPENSILGINNSPENYVAMLARAFSIIQDIAPSKLVLNAATTSIHQDFPETLNYNRAMRDAGAENFVDKWAIHYYGRQFENVVRDGGVQDFLSGLSKPIWVTESGERGVTEQLEYGEQVWPFLREKIPAIERIYVYQLTEATSPSTTYGLRNLTPGASVSDLYVFLRDR